MNKKAIVTSANLVTDQNNQPKVYNGQYGTMYFHAITFDNGDSGEYMSKSQQQNKFIPSQEAEYDLQPNTNPQYPAKIKPVQSDFKGVGKKGIDPKTMIASYAKDIVIAYINNGHKVEQSWFKSWADYIEKWVAGEEAKPPSKPQPQPDNEVTDDLPF